MELRLTNGWLSAQKPKKRSFADDSHAQRLSRNIGCMLGAPVYRTDSL